MNRKNRENAAYITSTLITHDPLQINDKQVRIASENDREEVMMMISDLVFIKSDGNYITVGYLKNGKITTVLFRNTMKYAMETLSAFPIIFRCHRSWLVNLLVILLATGIILAFSGYDVLDAGDFSLGYFSAGNFSIGVFSAGIFSVGIFSAGIFSVGIFSISIFNVGLYALGFFLLAWKKKYAKVRLVKEAEKEEPAAC